jgi:hypothetical protein
LPAEPATVPDRKVEKAELPRNAPQPAPAPPKELVSPNPAVKSEAAAPAAIATNRPNAAIAAQTPTKPPSAPQEISAGIAIPAPGLWSNKIIWITGLAVLGVTCAILIVLARRPGPGHISLITRSLEQDGND